MEATSLFPPLPQFLKEFLGPVAPDSVTYGIIEAAHDQTVRAQGLAPLLNADPGYRFYLFAQAFLSDRLAEWDAEMAEVPERSQIILERILGLLGKTPVRNLVACGRVERLLGNAPPTSTEDKLNTRPTQLIPFALEAERVCADRSWLLPEAAFSAGLHYDWLAAINKKRNAMPEEKSGLDAAFKEGILTAKIAYAIGEHMQEIKLGGSLFSAGLLLPLGKALMVSIYPNSRGEKAWTKFIVDCDQAGDRKLDYFQFMEGRRYPVTHAELASLFVNFAALCRPVEKALYFSGEPSRLKTVDKDLYQVCVVLSIASRIARSGGKPAALDPSQEAWQKESGITDEMLKSAAMAAGKG